MSSRTLLLLLALLLGLSQQATAQATYVTTLDFINMADAVDRLTTSPSETHSKKDLESAALLIGYVRGIADSLTAASMLCMPKGVSPRQIVAMTKMTVSQIPDAWHSPAAVFVGHTLLNKWKCLEKK